MDKESVHVVEHQDDILLPKENIHKLRACIGEHTAHDQLKRKSGAGVLLT